MGLATLYALGHALVVFVLGLGAVLLSVELPSWVGGDEQAGASLGDTVGRTEDGYHRAEQRAMLSDLMRSLTDREREVVRLRFEGDLTQAQIGEIVGVSQMQVSRVLRHAIAKLRVLARQGQDEDPSIAA